jgi:hypothetical protein
MLRRCEKYLYFAWLFGRDMGFLDFNGRLNLRRGGGSSALTGPDLAWPHGFLSCRDYEFPGHLLVSLSSSLNSVANLVSKNLPGELVEWRSSELILTRYTL